MNLENVNFWIDNVEVDVDYNGISACSMIIPNSFSELVFLDEYTFLYQYLKEANIYFGKRLNKKILEIIINPLTREIQIVVNKPIILKNSFITNN